MAKKPSSTNPLLGEVACQDCGGPEYVYQSKRRGNYLYGRCAECGINQKTGKAAQARLAAYVAVGGLQTPKPDPEPVKSTVTGAADAPPDDLYTGEPVPVTDPTPEPEATERQTVKAPSGRGLVGLIFGLLLVLGPVLISAVR